MKRILSFSLILVLLLSFLSGCGGAPAAPETEKASGTAAPEPPFLPEDAYYDGYTFTVLAAGAAPRGDFNSERMETPLLREAVYRRDREAQDALGITLRTKEAFGYLSAASRGEGYRALVLSYGAETCDYDLAAIGAYDAAVLSYCGLLQDLSALSFPDLSRPWWDQSVEKDLSFSGRLFLAAGDLLPANAGAVGCVLAQEALLGAEGARSLRSLVLEGRFTWEELGRAASALPASPDGETPASVIVSGGTVLSALEAAGCRLARTDADGRLTLTLGEPAVKTALAAYAALAFDPARSYSPQREGEAVGRWDALRDNAFASGDGIFCFTSLSAVPALRERGASFSVLPYPKVDPAAEYQSPLDLFGTDLLCLPFYQQDRERTGIVTEELAFLSRELVRPALADRYLPEAGARDGQETELFDLLLLRRAYDPGALYGLGDYPLTLPAADSPAEFEAAAEAGRSLAADQIGKINEKLAELYLGVR